MLKAIIKKAGKDKKQFRLHLIGKNGEKVFMTETYKRMAGALKALKFLEGAAIEYPVTLTNKKLSTFAKTMIKGANIDIKKGK